MCVCVGGGGGVGEGRGVNVSCMLDHAWAIFLSQLCHALRVTPPTQSMCYCKKSINFVQKVLSYCNTLAPTPHT